MILVYPCTTSVLPVALRSSQILGIIGESIFEWCAERAYIGKLASFSVISNIHRLDHAFHRENGDLCLFFQLLPIQYSRLSKGLFGTNPRTTNRTTKNSRHQLLPLGGAVNHVETPKK